MLIKVGMNTRSAPLIRASTKSGAHRVEFDISNGRDQVHMIWHQAIGPDFDPGPVQVIAEKPEVCKVIVITEKRRLPPAATLRDMVRKPGNDETRQE